MIIQSLLDTDLYKFTMMQVVLHHFPGAQAEYRFRCRSEGTRACEGRTQEQAFSVTFSAFGKGDSP